MRVPNILLRLLLIIVVVFALALSWSVSDAQDADSTEEQNQAEAQEDVPTDAPTDLPAPTDTPTAQPTEAPLPTALPTDIPTEIPTEPPTATDPAPTAEVTPDVTAPVVTPDIPTATEPPPDTETPTETVTLPPEPALRLLAADSFDGDLALWRAGDVWERVDIDGGRALRLTGDAGLIQFVQSPLEDVALQARVQVTQGIAQVLARQSADGNYSLSLSASGQVELARSGQVLASASVAPLNDGEWRVLRLSVLDGALRGSIDGEVVVSAIDPSPLPAGAVSLGGLRFASDESDANHLLLDDVMIYVAEGEEIPTPTPTDVQTEAPPVEVTETPSLEPTATEPVVEVTEAPTAEVTETPPVPTDEGRVIVTPEIVTYESTPVLVPQEVAAAASLSVPTPLSPANNAFIRDATPTLSWTPDEPPDGATLVSYQLQIATNNTFTQNRQVFNTGSAEPSYTLPSNLTQGKKYWRVRARFSNATWGTWSAVWSFTVDTIRPARPTLIGPTCGSATTDTTPTLSWGAVAGAFRYELKLDTISPPPNTAAYAAARTYTPGAPLLFTTYYWRVQAVDRAGNRSPWSVLCRLPIESANNAAPVLNRNETNMVTLSWTPISWATNYQVQVANNLSFTNPLYDNSTIPPGDLTTTTGALPNGTYYWRVRARKSDGSTWGGWSTTGTFTVEVSS